MKLNPIAVLVLVSGIMTGAIAVFSWQRRSANGARCFAALMFSVAVYVLGYSMELASSDLTTMLFWSKIQYLGILTFPVLYLIFVLQFTGHEKWLTRRNIALLFVIPAGLLTIKFFDEDLHLIYTSATVDTSGIIPLLAFERGPLYFLNAIYNLTIITAGNYLLWQKQRFASALFRRQTAIMLIAAVPIYLIYVVYLMGISPIPELKRLDPNPFAFMLWGIAIALSIFRYRLFDLVPIARDALIERLNDGVIVLDVQCRVVDANPQALNIFGWTRVPVGQFTEDLMPHWLDQLPFCAVEAPTKVETHLTKDNAPIYYETTLSTLQDKGGQKIGYLVVVHDISERKEIEKKLQELSLVDELTGLANRRGFTVLADQMINMANRMQLNAVLIYIDVDWLKWINDNLGHRTGDQALIDTATILKNTFRSSDIIARFGGDEFVILAIESVKNSRRAMLTRLQERLKARAPVYQNYHLSLSIGVARYEWKKPKPIESLLEEADRTMYEQKHSRKAQLKTRPTITNE
ncbi:MAG: diguanylate cyclase [Anaerolineae bacterium]|nr:diguanylate cyclase [Anaerolineae bacterium]